MQWDVSLTDFVLAAVSAVFALRAWGMAPARRSFAVGLCFVGSAAFAGGLRFAGVDAITPVHQWLSQLASLVGMPLIALSTAARFAPADQQRRLYFLLPIFVLGALLAPVVPGYRIGVGAGALGLCVVSCLVTRRWVNAVGAVMVMVAGLAVAGRSGAWMGLAFPAWFHILLIVALVMLGHGLQALPEESSFAEPRTAGE